MHCTNFNDCTDEVIYLDLDQLFDESGMYEYVCRGNMYVKCVVLFRTKYHPIKIGNNFLSYCINLTHVNLSSLTNVTNIGICFLTCCEKLISIDLSPLSSVTHIGDYFLCKCTNLTSIDLSPLSKVTYFGHYFLCCCENLTSIDLSPLSNMTVIGHWFLAKTNLTTIDLSPLTKLTSIGHKFLQECDKLTTIDLSSLSKLTTIGHNFLQECKKLTTIDLTPLSKVTQIGIGFLSRCATLSTIDLSPLFNVTQIGRWFLSQCINLTTLDLSPLSNITQLDENFLSECDMLSTIILNQNNDLLYNAIKKLSNVEIILGKYFFVTYQNDQIKFVNNKQFVVQLMKYLEIKFNKHIPNRYLIKKLNKYCGKYNRQSKTIANKCKNQYDIFSMEDLCDIPKRKIILIEKNNETYCGFDVILLRKYLFENKKEKYINPLTTNEICDNDIDKILKTNVKRLEYFVSSKK